MELKYNELYTTYVPYGLWAWCLLEMVGLLGSKIHVYLGYALVLGLPLYTSKSSREVSPVKRQMFNQMLSVMSDEIKKLGVEHDDEIRQTNDYIHDRISVLQSEISNSINTLQRSPEEEEEPEPAPECEKCMAVTCILCSGDGDTILECVDGFNHWWQCDVCKRDVEDPPIMHVETSMYVPRSTLETSGHVGPCLTRRGRSRTRKPVRTDRSRSRDREEEEDHRVGQTVEQRSCEHVFYTHVFGMYDKCKKCDKCGIEVF